MIRVDPEYRWLLSAHPWRVDHRGYVVYTLNRHPESPAQVSLHREVWRSAYGANPSLEIDHINEDKEDNRIENLRLASRRLNAMNSSQRKKRSYLPRGVAMTPSGKFKAQIMRHRKNHNLGHFDTAEQASNAYQNAKETIIEFEALLSEELT